METASQDSLDGSRMRPSSAIFALGGLAGRSMRAMFMPIKEDPGALVTPPQTPAAGIFTFEDKQGGDYVLDVAPEATKKSSKAVKAGKMTLEELQVEYMKLRKNKRALESKFQVLQGLNSKLRLENDGLRVEASHKGKLSSTVFLLEMEVKSLKASLTSESTQSLQKLLTATEENAAVRVKELNRKAVAARELAESLRQEFSQAAAQHAQQLSELQQQLTASLQKSACLQQECADANQRHAQELADLQKQHAQTLADMESRFQSRSSADAAQHASVGSELQGQVAVAAQQHSDSSAQAQVRHSRQLAAQCAIHRKMSQYEVTLVREYWMQHVAAVKKHSKEALTAAESCHSAELVLLRAELNVYKQGEADRVGAVKQQYDSKLRDACSQHAALVTQLQEELAVAKGLQSTQHPGQMHSPVTTPGPDAAQSGDQQPHINLAALELPSCTSTALSTSDTRSTSTALSTSDTRSTSTTVSTDIAQCRSSPADAAVTAVAQSTSPATLRAYPLLEKWLAAGTDRSTMGAQESVPAKHIISAAKQQDALPACDTILAVRSGSASTEQLQQQRVTPHSASSTGRSSKLQLQADSALTCMASRSSSSGELQPEAVGLASASCSTAASSPLTSSSSLVRPSGASSSTLLTIAAYSPASCYQPTPDQQPQQQLVTALAADKGHITRSSSSTSAESSQAMASLVDSTTPAQAYSARVADASQASSVKQTVLGCASGVKKAVSDQASIMKKTEPKQATDFENFQPVAVPFWATANDPDDKESSSVVDSYTKSSLLSSPWDAAAAAAELDASGCDEVDYELLWTKGPQYWYGDDDDDWGVDDE